MRSKTGDKIIRRVKSKDFPYTIDFDSFELLIDEGVYPPGEEGLFLANYLRNGKFGVKKNEKVLDYGTGSGYLALISAKLGANVVGIDVNPLAIKCSDVSAGKNKLSDKTEFRVGKNFEAVEDGEKFDVIVANLPYEDADAKDYTELIVYDPGFEMRKSLFENAFNHLSENGRILFSYSESAEKKSPLSLFAKDFKFEVVERKELDGENYFIAVAFLG